MEKKGLIQAIGGTLIFIIILLVIFTFFLKDVTGQSSSSINDAVEAQTGRSGGEVSSEQARRLEINLNSNNKTFDLSSQIFEKDSGENLAQIPTYVDSRIEEQLNKSIEVPVIVKVKDTSRIKVTIKDAIEIQELKDRTKKDILKNKTDKILSQLSTNEFKLKDRFPLENGFYGNTTREGFDNLIRNSEVAEIFFDGFAHVILDKSRPLINADDVESAGYTGLHQTACVIDSGIDYTHSDLGGCFGATCKVRGGWNYDNDSGIPMDNANHGTLVAGIIASENSNKRGMAPNARLVAMRVCNDAGTICQDSFITSALQYCYNNRNIYNISVVSISLGDGDEYTESDCPTTSRTEINDLYSVNIPVIAASGNEAHTNGISWPACRGNVTSVGAVYDENVGSYNAGVCTDSTTQADKLACFTNRKVGTLDLLAPGCKINSTKAGGGYYVDCGTSFAAPHVSGSVLLLRHLNKTLTPNQIENAFKNTGVAIGDYKRIDALAALNSFRDKDNDEYYDQAYSGSDCNDNNAAIHPGATEACDDVDNDCDGTIDEGCTEECSESGYEQCASSSFGDCDVQIAVNYYDAVNTIRWGVVNDSNDPYVISQYSVGWTSDGERRYYDVNDPDNDCDYSGCTGGTSISSTGTRVTTSAPATASTENLVGHTNTASNWCAVWFNGFNPNYGAGNPIFVLNCFADSDCSASSYCNKTGIWNQWACVIKYADGVQCTQDYQCSSNYCDNEGIGLSDDGWCFTPYSIYFDGQENTYCEYSTDNGIEDCDERQSGADLDKCIGTSYYEEECSSSCTYQDVTSIFECTDSGCSCSEPLCDGLTTGSSITNCSYNYTYFADKCTSTASGEDRTDNVCRSSSFASGCTASSPCNGVAAGTNTESGSCSLSCSFDAFPNVTLVRPQNNNVSTVKDILFNCSATDDNLLRNITLYHNISGTWTANETKSVSGTSDFQTFEINNTPNGKYIWNCFGYDNSSLSDWGNSNFTITINFTQPINNLTITSLQNIHSNSTLRVFEFIVENNGNTNLENVSWNFDTNNNDVINSTINTSLTAGEQVFVFLQYNYSGQGTYNVKANASTGNISDIETTIIEIGDLLITLFNDTFIEGTRVIFEAIVKNNLESESISNIDWSLATGDGTIINSNLSTNLSGNETIFIFIENQYSSADSYNPVFNVSNNVHYDSEGIWIYIPSLVVNNLSLLDSNGTKRIFEFIIENQLTTNLSNVSWIFDTKNSNVINSTIPIELQANGSIFVFIEYNFTGSGVFNTNATGRNGTLSDSTNLTITI